MQTITWIDDLTADLPTLATPRETADLLRCSRRELYRRIDRGELTVLRRTHHSSARLLIPKASIVAYLRRAAGVV